jgi:hypothetical protein
MRKSKINKSRQTTTTKIFIMKEIAKLLALAMFVMLAFAACKDPEPDPDPEPEPEPTAALVINFDGTAWDADETTIQGENYDDYGILYFTAYKYASMDTVPFVAVQMPNATGTYTTAESNYYFIQYCKEFMFTYSDYTYCDWLSDTGNYTVTEVDLTNLSTSFVFEGTMWNAGENLVNGAEIAYAPLTITGTDMSILTAAKLMRSPVRKLER